MNLCYEVISIGLVSVRLGLLVSIVKYSIFICVLSLDGPWIISVTCLYDPKSTKDRPDINHRSTIVAHMIPMRYS